jgi:hypothetical protein
VAVERTAQPGGWAVLSTGTLYPERFVVCKPLPSKIEWTKRTCVVKRRCVFSTILWIIIIVVALLALGFFARGRRR